MRAPLALRQAQHAKLDLFRRLSRVDRHTRDARSPRPNSRLVFDIASTGGSFPEAGAALPDGTVIFTAIDGIHGREPWRTDGTAAGTFLLRDILPGNAPFTNHFGSDATGFVLLRNLVYFFARDTSGVGLWRTDGTRAGTTLVRRGVQGRPTDRDGWCDLLQRRRRKPKERSSGDPTERPPERSESRICGREGAASSALHTDRDRATSPYFETGSSSPPRMVRTESSCGASDGTAAGTTRWDLFPGRSGSFPRELVVFRDALWFVAHDATAGTELWSSDGTRAGTSVFLDILPGLSYTPPRELTVTTDRMFFAATSNAFGTELWSTDATIPGTGMVRDLVPGPNSASPDSLTALGNRLLFRPRTSAMGREPWSRTAHPLARFPSRISRREPRVRATRRGPCCSCRRAHATRGFERARTSRLHSSGAPMAPQSERPRSRPCDLERRTTTRR